METLKTLPSNIPNWLQSLLVALGVALGAYVTNPNGQQLTWGGLIAALVAGGLNWWTTHAEKEKNKALTQPQEGTDESGGDTNF